jgi:hypothetical protein
MRLRMQPSHPRAWDGGINTLRITHLLFGAQPLGKRPARLRFRYCGRDGQDAIGVAHYDRVLTRADLVGGAAL